MKLHSVCPTDIVDTPAETVWALLTNPSGWGSYFDATVKSVIPEGHAVQGQRVGLATGSWPFRFLLTFEFTGVDEVRHELAIDIRLPFGIVNHERLSVTPLGANACRVSYGCNFYFPDGWRGRLLWTLFRRQFESGPADSLARLKRAAEERARTRADAAILRGVSSAFEDSP